MTMTTITALKTSNKFLRTSLVGVSLLTFSTVQATTPIPQSPTPVVSGNTISVAEDGWYQFQNSGTFKEHCAGTFECTVPAGSYIVINHSTGQRWESVLVTEQASGIPVADGLTIHFPDTGWYQVQDKVTYQSVCNGLSSCVVPAGNYNVINHTSSQRWDSVAVSDARETNTFLLPDNGWYQVQNAADYTSICEGVTQCAVVSGTYNVINHSSGQRYEAIGVGLVRTAGHDWIEEAELIASDGVEGGLFGRSVYIDGDTAIVGAGEHNDKSGAAYIFRRHEGGADVWSEVVKLTASDAAAGKRFGRNVSVSGDIAIVGAIFANSAYIFHRDEGGPENWGELKKLTGSFLFGSHVSISGDTAIVGSSSENAAYVFQRDEGGPDNWGMITKLTPSDTTDQFGWGVAITGDTAVVGASGDDSFRGAAYVFQRNKGGSNSWGEVKKLTASDAAPSDQFGNGNVAINGDTVIVGAGADDDHGEDSGSVYIFERDEGGADNWGEVRKLTASDGATRKKFGFSVSISGDTVLVGTPEDTDAGDPGTAYVFERYEGGPDNWGEVTKLASSDLRPNDSFGWSVSVSKDTAIVGAQSAEASYIFKRLDRTANIEIDIKPGNKQNVINPRAKGGIWVAILSDTDTESPFDPSSQVDISTVEFGPGGAKAIRHKVQDVNKDGLGDLLLRFKIPATGIACGDTEAILAGETFDGQSIKGTDSIKTVGCKPEKHRKKKHHF